VTSISAEVAADHVDADEDHAPQRKLRPDAVADPALPRRERRGEPSEGCGSNRAGHAGRRFATPTFG
jgi:hypothetical protein